MSKFAKAGTAAVASPIQTVSKSPDTMGHEAAGFSRDPKSELFLLAVTNMVGEKTFYENAKNRDARFEDLIHQTTVEDAGWIRRFVPYLRDTMNMRSASIVMAAEYVRAGGGDGRAVINSACQRADEPAEMLAYWITRYGKNLPKPVKRGLADAVTRLYSERSALKYDSAGSAFRMADVLELVHPKPKAPWQGELFKYLITKRHNRENISTEGLATIAAHGSVASLSQDEIRKIIAEAGGDENVLEAGGWTWEALSAKYGKLDAAFWEAMIPNMGIFALVRNLRNFDDAGISEAAATAVAIKLQDPEVIAKSRMFPLRFYSAWKNTTTMNWGKALEVSLELSLQNVPSLKGRTLVLVDVSSSMDGAMSDKSKATRYEVASIFGGAIATRAEKATLVAFSTGSAEVQFGKVGSVLRIADAINKAEPHMGTNTAEALRRHYDNHDRVVLVTDEQAFAPLHQLENLSNPNAMAYTFNVAGYRAGHAASSPRHHTFGGLSDAGFVAVDLLERGKSAEYPF